MLAPGAGMPTSSALQHPPSPPLHLGHLGGYSYKSGVAMTTAFMMQVDVSAVRNGSIQSWHFQCRPWKVLSKSQRTRIGSAYKKNWGLESCLLEGVYKLLRIQKFLPSPIICRAEDTEASNWQREEARWLREEKRWLREEERWLREEARWAAERKELLERALISEEQITALKLEIAQQRNRGADEELKDETISNLIVNLTSLLQSLNTAASPGTDHQGASFQAQISSLTSTHTDINKALGDFSVGSPTKSTEKVEPVSQPSILEFVVVPTVPSQSDERKRKVLRRGAEGAEVKAMQDALAKLGFYSGDEDMEYSTFSSGTERAVRSWQAALGALEDGIITTELLKKLLGEETPEGKTTSSPSQASRAPSAKAAVSNSGAKGVFSEGKTGGTVKATASSSVTSAKDFSADLKAKASAGAASEKQTNKKADLSSPKMPQSNGASQPRVYLLGENRWEEPDRLLSKNGPTVTAAVTKMLGERCFACKGQGNMMCTECEGTGALNVEEQFLEWADEDAKCPYCEGKGAVDCDVCDGKGVKTFA